MFKNKTVIVTGGSRGIGKQIVIDFARQGANVVINYSSTEPTELVSQLTNDGYNVCSFKANVADFNESKELVKFAKKTYGSVDVLVNNAGITKDNLIIMLKEDDFDSVIDVNLKGSFNMMKHVTKIMLKQKSGTIINMSSFVGLAGNMGQVNYAASKAGVLGMTKSLAREIGSRGITVNAVCPGFIDTDMTNFIQGDVKDKITSLIPLQRIGTTDDVSNLVLFLAQSKYITGQCISVDGGMNM